jgi:single-strand DNA-binding protein
MVNVAQAARVFKNEAHVAGELAKDPVIKFTPSGKKVATITVVTKHDRFSEYHRIIAWEKLADKCEDLTKGAFIKTVGSLRTRSWDDKQSGQKRYITEIVAFQLATEKSEPPPITPDLTRSGTSVASAILRPAEGTSQKNVHGIEIGDDDIPF